MKQSKRILVHTALAGLVLATTNPSALADSAQAQSMVSAMQSTATQTDELDELIASKDHPDLVTETQSLLRTEATPRSRRAGDFPLYDLMFKGEDLTPGERYYRGKAIHSDGGSQKWGYDLSAVRKVGDSWSTKRSSYDPMDPKNEDYFIYGKPVYAMGEARVIRCWRNAPDNPRPFSSALGDTKDAPESEWNWHHPKKRAGYIGGGGNHLLVEEADGSWILYAHFRSGTIPTTLCPHNDVYLSTPGATSEMDVPETQQTTIQPGQFLGKGGNSGRSTGPHSHIHRQDQDGTPLELRFRHGLATPLVNGVADLDDVASFKSERIPPGKVLIWPPRTIGKEYARHKFLAKDYQRLFKHLEDSGAQPVWFDAYSVDGQPYFNFVWRKANGLWRSYFLLTEADYQAKFNKAKQDGYEPIQVESSLVNGKARYSVIFEKNVPGGYIARHGLSEEQHQALMDEAKAKHLNPVNISVVSVRGKRSYTVLYRGQNIGSWQVKSQVPVSEYQALYNQNKQAGRRPYYLAAYMHNGTPYYSVIFSSKPSGSRKDKHGLTVNEYQSEFNSAHQSGLLTRVISGYDGAEQNHRYIAMWRK